jgi:N-acetylglucosamine-6-phosphate deacetylase
MIDAVRNLHALGASFEEAIAAATEVPARVIGERSAGSLVRGTPADVVVLSEELELLRVLVGGADRLS